MEDFGYRKLIVWQKSVELVWLEYEEIKKFPLDESVAVEIGRMLGAMLKKYGSIQEKIPHLCSPSPLTFT